MAASTSSSCSVSGSVSDNTGFNSDLDSATEESELDQEKWTVASLLDRLKSPTSADIARPRKTKMNDPPRGKLRPCKGALASDLKGVTPSQRVKEFKNKSLTVLRGHLFCSACCEQLSLNNKLF